MRKVKTEIEDAHGNVKLTADDETVTLEQDDDVVMLKPENLHRIAAYTGETCLIRAPALKQRVIAKSSDNLRAPFAGTIVEYHRVSKVDAESYEKLRVEMRGGIITSLYRTDPESAIWRSDGYRYALYEA